MAAKAATKTAAKKAAPKKVVAGKTKKIKAGPEEVLKPKKKYKAINQYADGRARIMLAKGAADLIANPESIKDWDDDELYRGQRKDKNGKFTGQPPKVVPTECYKEMHKRTMEWAKRELTHNTRAAIKALGTIVDSEVADPHARIKASGMILDRVLGKPKETVEFVGEDAKWMQVMNVAIVNVLPEQAQEAIDTTATVIASPTRKRKTTEVAE